MSQSTRVRNNAEIRRMAGVWAKLLRERLDQFAAPKE
jgi:hypothetical protein